MKHRTSKPNYILSTQQIHTIIIKSSFSPKIQQRIHFQNLNTLNKTSHHSDSNSIAELSNRVTNSTTYNDRVHPNTIFCYPIYNNTNNTFLLTTRQIIYTYSCGQKTTLALQYTPICRLANNKSNRYHTHTSRKNYISALNEVWSQDLQTGTIDPPW